MQSTETKRSWTGLETLRPALEVHLARRCRDAHEVDDIVQETLLRAARYRTSLADPERLRAWALRIATNVLRDHVRRETRLPRAESSDELFDAVEGREGTPDDATVPVEVSLDGARLERDDALLHLSVALGELRGEDRAVLDAYYAGTRNCRETGRACDIAPDLVKVRLFRARKRLLRVLRARLDAQRATEAAAAGSQDTRRARCTLREKRSCVAGCERKGG